MLIIDVKGWIRSFRIGIGNYLKGNIIKHENGGRTKRNISLEFFKKK